MNEQPPFAPTLLEALRSRITRVMPAQIRACLDELDEAQIWWRPNEASNSVGNLVLHLSGSLNHYLNFLIGGIKYKRDRDQEFAERREIPKAELRAIFEGMVAGAVRTMDALSPERLGEPSPEQKMYTLLVEDLVAIATHISAHTGQILWITKMLREGSLDDVWIKTHRQLGGFKPRQ